MPELKGTVGHPAGGGRGAVVAEQGSPHPHVWGTEDSTRVKKGGLFCMALYPGIPERMRECQSSYTAPSGHARRVQPAQVFSAGIMFGRRAIFVDL